MCKRPDDHNQSHPSNQEQSFSKSGTRDDDEHAREGESEALRGNAGIRRSEITESESVIDANLDSAYLSHQPGNSTIPETAAKQSAPLLEYIGNSCGQNQIGIPKYEIAPCRCKSWYCLNCRKYKGLEIRFRLLPVIESFNHVMMLTLTIDPDLFNTPNQAFLHIRQKRALSELVRALHKKKTLITRRYFYVIEWHKNEWPHYHMLLESSRIPYEMIIEFWGRNRPKTAGPVRAGRSPFGHILFSAPRFKNKSHAAFYATKYLIKPTDTNYPEWVLSFEGRIPAYGASKGLLKESSASPKRPEDEIKKNKKKKRKIKRTIKERTEMCGEKSVLFRKVPYMNKEGELKEERQFWSEVHLPFSDIQREKGMDPTKFKAFEISEKEMRTIIRLDQETGFSNPNREQN